VCESDLQALVSGAPAIETLHMGRWPSRAGAPQSLAQLPPLTSLTLPGSEISLNLASWLSDSRLQSRL
jgi:hypothetical protein